MRRNWKGILGRREEKSIEEKEKKHDAANELKESTATRKGAG